MTTLEMIAQEIKVNGFAKYKASIVIPSNKLEGWFMDKSQTTFAPSLSELLFDLDFLQRNIDYDQDVRASKVLLSAFESFKGA